MIEVIKISSYFLSRREQIFIVKVLVDGQLYICSGHRDVVSVLGFPHPTSVVPVLDIFERAALLCPVYALSAFSHTLSLFLFFCYTFTTAIAESVAEVLSEQLIF